MYDAVRLAGACYLLWLAVDHFRSAGSLDELEPPAHRSSTRRVYLRAITNNLTNPKVILFFVAFLPQFVVPDAGPPTVQFVILGTPFLLVGLVLDTIIGLLSGRLGNTLRRRKWVTKLLDRIAGTILAGLGLRLALNDSRP